jgi:chromosome segregation ATPase
MLLLSDASLVVFLKFLQILLWISIPALVIAMLITTVIHYKNKRKKIKKEEEQLLIFENESKRFSGYDDFSLIPHGVYLPGSKHEVRGIIHRLFHSNARYIAIRKDFEMLNEKYKRLHINIHQDSETIKNKTMETIHTDMQQTLQEQIGNIKQQHEIEKKELYNELTQLTEAYENLEKDNTTLRDQLVAYSSDENKTTAVIQKWEVEKAELKKRLSEQDYLKEVLEEKKVQISFLQQQLEQRIKNHHLVEQQFRELGIKFMEVKEDLEIKQQTEKEFQTTIHDKEQEIIFLKGEIQSKSDHAAQLETEVKTLQTQNENLSLNVEDNKRLLENYREQLAQSSDQKEELERKLEKNNTLLKGFHKKLSDVIEEEMTASPVIIMKPVYMQENAEAQLTESVIQ